MEEFILEKLSKLQEVLKAENEMQEEIKREENALKLMEGKIESYRVELNANDELKKWSNIDESMQVIEDTSPMVEALKKTLEEKEMQDDKILKLKEKSESEKVDTSKGLATVRNEMTEKVKQEEKKLNELDNKIESYRVKLNANDELEKWANLDESIQVENSEQLTKELKEMLEIRKEMEDTIKTVKKLIGLISINSVEQLNKIIKKRENEVTELRSKNQAPTGKDEVQAPTGKDEVQAPAGKDGFQPPAVIPADKDGFQPPAVIEESKPVVKINIRTGEYCLYQGNDCIINMDIDTKLISGKKLKEFKEELVEKYKNFTPDENVSESIEEIIDWVDPNLYKMYQEYDKMNQTNFCLDYITSVRMENKDNMPADVTYDVRKLNDQKQHEEGNVKLGFLSKMRLKKIAENHQKMEIAEVKEDPKMKLWKKAAIALGLGAMVGGTMIGASTQKPIEPRQDERFFKEDLRVKLEESKIKEKQTNEMEEIGIGSTATISEGTYYYTSEGGEPIGKIENRDNKTVEISLIATVEENGVFSHAFHKDEDKIKAIKEANPNAKIMVHISQCLPDGTKGGDYGWISYDEVKENFEQVQRQKNGKISPRNEYDKGDR